MVLLGLQRLLLSDPGTIHSRLRFVYVRPEVFRVGAELAVYGERLVVTHCGRARLQHNGTSFRTLGPEHWRHRTVVAGSGAARSRGPRDCNDRICNTNFSDITSSVT